MQPWPGTTELPTGAQAGHPLHGCSGQGCTRQHHLPRRPLQQQQGYRPCS
jgi:hypothetical protein